MVALQKIDIQEQYEGLPIDTVIHGDCLAEMRKLSDNSIHAIVTDPPYGLGEVKNIAALLLAWCRGEDGKEYANKKGFMSKDWDVVPSPQVWKEAYRVLRPGGYLLAFAGTRTWDLMSMSIRLAGFEDRDTINHAYGSQHLAWIQGQGFPKSTNISAMIDKRLGKERDVIGKHPHPLTKSDTGRYQWNTGNVGRTETYITSPATPESARWTGYGSATKPAWEPILVFRKPLDGTLAENVLTWGCGGLNIDQCRVGLEGIEHHRTAGSGAIGTANGIYSSSKDPINRIQQEREQQGLNPRYDPSGRFPSNLLLSHDPRCLARGTKRVRGNNSKLDDQLKHNGNGSRLFGQDKPHVTTHGYADEHGQEEVQAFECHPSCPVRVLGEQSGERNSHGTAQRATYGGIFGNGKPVTGPIREGDTGTASRYFQQFHDPLETLDAPFHYFSKSSRRERSLGCENLPYAPSGAYGEFEGDGRGRQTEHRPAQNNHPTVKPLQLMSWLCRLITPPGGIVLDPFCGSGSTCCAAVYEGMHFIGIEQSNTPDAPYVDIARARIAHAQQESKRAESEGQEYDCVEECPIKVLDAQSGISRSTIHNRGKGKSSANSHEGWKRPAHQQYPSTRIIGHDDTGGASRYFQQFAPEPVSLWDEEVAE